MRYQIEVRQLGSLPIYMVKDSDTGLIEGEFIREQNAYDKCNDLNDPLYPHCSVCDLPSDKLTVQSYVEGEIETVGALCPDCLMFAQIPH